MGAVLNLPYDAWPPVPRLDTSARGCVNRLRFVATRCRASARLDISTLVRAGPAEISPEVAAQVLVRILGQALGTPPIWHRAGAKHFSFDEIWLAQILTACAQGDTASFDFLTRRRVAAPMRAPFAAVVRRLSI